MNMNLTNARKEIVFADNARKFNENYRHFLSEAANMTSVNKQEAIVLVREIAIDLQSRLASWTLKKNVKQSEIDKAVAECYAFLNSQGAGDAVDAVKKEAVSIAQSATIKACEAFAFFWGHDYCTGIDYSLRRGACFVTSNPAKINQYRKENVKEWDDMLKTVRVENPQITPEMIVSHMYVKVVSMIAEKMRPIYDASNGKYGFVCIQPNPKTTKDSQAMVNEVLFWKNEFGKRFGDENINIVFKIPAVPAALESVRILKKYNLRLCITLNFSVFQHDLFSDLLTGGEHGDFLVLMGGIVDDQVAKELKKQGIDEKIATEYSHYAASAVLRSSYANLKAKGLNPIIMNGSVRGPWSIYNCFTADMARPIALTSMANKVEEFDSEPRSLFETVNTPIPEDVMKVLTQSTIFTKAYLKDGLTCENLEEYPPLVTVGKSFVDAYEETLASVK